MRLIGPVNTSPLPRRCTVCAWGAMFWARQGGGDWDDSSSSSSSSSTRSSIKLPFLRTSALTSCTTRGGFTFSTWVSAASEPLLVAQALHGAIEGSHGSPTALMAALELNQRMLSTLPDMAVDVRSGACGSCLPGCSSCTGLLRCTACAPGYTRTPLLSLLASPASGQPHALGQLLSGLDVCLPAAAALRITAEHDGSVTAMSGPPAAAPAPGLLPPPVAAGATLPGPHSAAPMPAPAREEVVGAPMPAHMMPLVLAPAPALGTAPGYLDGEPPPLQLASAPTMPFTSWMAPPPVLPTVAAATPVPPHGLVIAQPTVIALAVTVVALLLVLCAGMARRASRSRGTFVVKAGDDALECGVETPRGK